MRLHPFPATFNSTGFVLSGAGGFDFFYGFKCCGMSFHFGAKIFPNFGTLPHTTRSSGVLFLGFLRMWPGEPLSTSADVVADIGMPSLEDFDEQPFVLADFLIGLPPKERVDVEMPTTVFADGGIEMGT